MSLNIQAYTASPAFAISPVTSRRTLFTARRLEPFILPYPSDIIYSAILTRRGLSAIWTREPLIPIHPARYCCRSRRRQVFQKRRLQLARLDTLTLEGSLMIHRNLPMSTSSRVESNVDDL